MQNTRWSNCSLINLIDNKTRLCMILNVHILISTRMDEMTWHFVLWQLLHMMEDYNSLDLASYSDHFISRIFITPSYCRIAVFALSTCHITIILNNSLRNDKKNTLLECFYPHLSSSVMPIAYQKEMSRITP